jgi:DNA polymerase-3 subunit alpha
VFAGLVVDVANFPNRMMVTLDDGTARIEISTNHGRFQRFKDIVQVDKVVVIEGEIYEREGFDRPLGRLTKAFSLNEIRQKRANSIKITLQAEHYSKTLSRDLQQILMPYTNVDMSTHIPVILYLDYGYATAELHLGLSWKVAPLDDLLAKLRDYFGKTALYIEYQVRSKAARAVSYEEAKPVEVPPPPADMSMDEALAQYEDEAESQLQYS